MEIEQILDKTKIRYEAHKKSNNFKYVEFENESIAVIIKNKGNVFKISRDLFFEIDDLLLPYIFILIDVENDNKYIFKIKEPNNSIRNAFDSTKKNEIYFGKEVLQNKVNDERLVEELKKIGE